MIRIGILGAAGIAPNAIILPARRRADVTIAAVAARDADRADAYAREHGIPTSYVGYERLLGDPEIDLVYNALPPSGHAEWSIAALEAGKDVLCEKPFAMNAAQAAEMTAAAERTGRRLIEAFHDRYHPLTAAVSDILASGVLGRVTSLTAVFSADNPYFPGSLRHEPELGGGALMDLGCYPVHWLRTFGAAAGGSPDDAGPDGGPAVTNAAVRPGPAGADERVEARLDLGAGIEGWLESSMMPGTALAQTLHAEGENGTLAVAGVVFPSRGHSIRVVTGGVPRVTTVAGAETYDHQLAAVLAGLETGERLPTEGADPVANMAVIDAIYAAAGMARPA